MIENNDNKHNPNKEKTTFHLFRVEIIKPSSLINEKNSKTNKKQ